jgi:hypothetical protein
LPLASAVVVALAAPLRATVALAPFVETFPEIVEVPEFTVKVTVTTAGDPSAPAEVTVMCPV